MQQFTGAIMGREIVYCEGCGKRLSEDDFERGKAQDHDNRPFCSGCRPVAEPTPKRTETERRNSSSSFRRRNPTERIPRAQPPPGTSRSRPSDADRAPGVAWFIGGAGAVLAIIVAAVMAMSGGRTVPPTDAVAPLKPPPDSSAGSEERLRELESFATAAADPEAILVRCDQLRGTLRGAALEARFRLVETRALDRLKEKERSAELDRALASIRRIIQDDIACARRSEVETLLGAALKSAGARSGEVQALQAEYRSRCDEAAKREEAKKREEAAKRDAAAKPPPRKWSDCFTLGTSRIQANDYPGAKILYLEGLATLPETRPEDLPQRFLYCVGLYNLACIYSVESAKLTDKARSEAVDLAFSTLDRALRGDYGRFRCPCHAQTGGIGHLGDDKDMDPLRKDARFAELIKKYKQ